MPAKRVTVELFFAVGCSKCAEARDALREAAQSTGRADWKETDIAKDPNRAVDAGVMSTPAVAIDGKLIVSPTPSDLRKAIEARAGKR